jgi:hypothetical protein
MECKNCFIKYSPVWRKGYCNACSVHYKKHGVHKNVEEIYAKILCSIKKSFGVLA